MRGVWPSSLARTGSRWTLTVLGASGRSRGRDAQSRYEAILTGGHDGRGRRRTAKPGDAKRQAAQRQSRPTGRRVARRLRSDGRLGCATRADPGISRNVCRAGKAGCPANPVVTEACVHLYQLSHARPSDAAGIRLSLRPLSSEARDETQSSGESRRENDFGCFFSLSWPGLSRPTRSRAQCLS